MGLFDTIKGIVGGGIFSKKARKSASNFFTGTPGKIQQVSNLRPDQEGLSEQLVNAGKGEGAGGAFGTVADYYRNLMSDDSKDYNAFAAPAMRQYSQDIAPGIAEQYAGFGSGSLGSSGFRNAQIQGGVDLSERLGALRANLRQSGAQGLQNIGQLGLQSFQQNYQTPGSEGLLSSVAPAIGTAAATAAGGPVAGLVSAASNWFGGNSGNNVGANSSPYGSSPRASAAPSQRPQLPNFMQGTKYGGY